MVNEGCSDRGEEERSEEQGESANGETEREREWRMEGREKANEVSLR